MCKGLIDFEDREGPRRPSDMSSCIDACQRISPSLSCSEGNYLSSDHSSSPHHIVSISHFLPYGVKWLVHFVAEKNRNPWHVMRSCLSASHGCSQLRLLVQLHGDAMTPWGKSGAAGGERAVLPGGRCKLAAEGQWMHPCRRRGLFGSVSHPVGGVGEAAISKEQFSVPSWK